MPSEIELKVITIFKENQFQYDWYVGMDGLLNVTVERGDWRHDHLALDWVMCENGFEAVEKRMFGGPTYDDSYSAVHVFKKV